VPKRYKLSSDNIVVGLADSSPCFATDRITVDGAPVGYMYRDDTGWNFFAGDESQDYVDNPNNLGLFALNDLANYDRSIVPYLQAAPGTAWVRQGGTFVQDPDGAPIDPDELVAGTLNPEFPIVEGRFDMTRDWSIALDQPMNRRIEDDALVLWRPGLTAWVNAWGNPHHEPPIVRLNKLRAMSAPKRYNENNWAASDLLYSTYRLDEASDGQQQSALYGFVVGPNGHVQIAVYFDHDANAATDFVRRIGPNGHQTHASLTIN